MATLDERLAKMTPLQRAVLALKETQARLEVLERRQAEPVAIIGMGCRFPGGVNDPASYWRLLTEGGDAVREIPPERWDVDVFYDPDPRAPGKMNTRWGGFLEGIEDFDNHFFGISDREASRIDPQHRLLLEVAWEALEDAGLPPASLRGSRTGVFVGISHSEYGIILSTDTAQADAYVASGTAHCIAANRVSFLFDFVGPSVALDTACSASLVSTHLACQSLRGGECEVALAGGVNIMLSPMATVNLTKAGFSAPDGRVRAFDAAAGGYVRSEGAGLVVLKLLSAAVRNGDPIYALIRGSAVNQNGFGNGLTAPSRRAQESVIREAYAAAKVSPEMVQYVEAQGTGTRLGDAIEAAALGAVVGRVRPQDSPCAIGSVKTNLGHLEAASGVASLMKVALALKYRQLPSTLHFQTPNPDIPFDDLRLKVQGQLEPWPCSAQPRLAGVSAFGFGGSNAHVVLEEAPPEAAPPTVQEPAAQRRVLPLSARTEAALRDLAQEYVGFLRGNPPPWRDICHTAATGRDHHDCRLVVLADSPQQGAEALEGFLAQTPTARVRTGRKPFGRDLKVAFLFDGRPEPWRDLRPALERLGAQLPDEIGEIDAVLYRVAGWDLAAVLRDGARWDQPAYALPAAVALQLGLAAGWRRAGVLPQVVLGRGSGELAAACVAGILAPEEALRIAVACGRGDGPRAWHGVTHREATLPFISASDGQQHDGRGLEAAHWERCLKSADSLEAALDRLQARQPDVCLEIGPETLAFAVRPKLATAAAVIVATVGAGDDTMLEAVAALYTAGANLSWAQIVADNGRCVRIPTYPWQRRRLWVERKDWLANSAPESTVPSDTPSISLPSSGDAQRAPGSAGGQAETNEIRARPEMNAPYVAPRTPLEQTLARAWSEILKIDRVGVHDNFFELGGDSLQAMMLHNALQDQLGEVVLGYVLFQAQTIGDLADYMRGHFAEAIRRIHPDEPNVGEPAAAAPATAVGDNEVAGVRQLVDVMAPIPPVSYPIREKNPRAVFILSPPRSGSTLFRVMLAGHDRLFAPPELELLHFNTLAEQRAAYADVPGQWLEGFVRTVMETRACGVDEARRLIREWEDSGVLIQQVYRWLQDPLGDRLLVDKTPSYSGRLAVLQRAEQLFEEPLYLHLLRHPCGMIRSFVDYNMHEAFRIRFKVRDALPFAPQQIAELVWTISHQNILRLLQDIPPSRQYRVRFEDAVHQPEATMRGVCQFLGLDYQAEMISPYAHPERKMVDGVVSQDRMHGDQKFVVKHKAIDPTVADSWKKHVTGDFLGPPARRLAAEFGYGDLPPEPTVGSAAEPSAGLAKRTSGDGEAAELLRRLDEISDEEVAALLQEHLKDEARRA